MIIIIALPASATALHQKQSKPKISKTKAILYVGQTLSLKTTGLKSVKWSSSNKKVAAVTKGKVTAKSAGTATITAASGKTKLKCKVTVKAITLSSKKVTTTVGQVVPVTVSCKDVNKGIVTWKSSNSSVAKIQVSNAYRALIIGRNPGTCTVTATIFGKAYKCSVTVKNRRVVKIATPIVTPRPTATPKPTVTPRPANTPVPTPVPTNTPTPTPKPAITVKARPAYTYDDEDLPDVTPLPTATPMPAEPYEVSLESIAPKLPENIISAWNAVEFKVIVDPQYSVSGIFVAKKGTITLQYLKGDNIYHEIGHFIDYVNIGVSKTQSFQEIFEKELDPFPAYNKPYASRNSSEYFAEAVRTYYFNRDEMKEKSPLTYSVVENAINSVTDSKAKFAVAHTV